MSEYITDVDGHVYGMIVRCGDCDHAWETEGGALRCHGYLVDAWDYYNDEPSEGKEVDEEDFCAWAERKVDS